MPPKTLELGQSPLTDVRSVGSSLFFHAALLLTASLAILGESLPGDDGPRALYGELGPVDNRAPYEPGGGGPGELGGRLPPEAVQIAADGQSPDSRAVPDPAAQALLEEILPASSSPDASQRALPGPLNTGVGVLPGPGAGGGGGSGGGSGGGVGRGVGPGTQFFGARENADSFAYVIDCSGSMTNRSSLDIAKRELLASLAQLPPDTKFGVVFYNERPSVFLDTAGRPNLMPATAENKARFESRLAKVPADGGTNHIDALRAGLALKPEVIFFLTDADLMTPREAEGILSRAGSTRIQAVEFGVGPDPGVTVPLRTLATASGGTYRYIDVMTFSGLDFDR